MLAAGTKGAPAESSAEPLEFESAVLDPEESLALRLLSKQLGVTTNDLLLRDLLIVLRRWNSGHGGTARGRFRINVPVNVRTRARRGTAGRQPHRLWFCLG